MSPVVLAEQPWLVLNKASGMSVHNAQPGELDLVGWLRREGRHERPVHRLDKGTSGLVLCASGEAAAQVGAWFVGGEVRKTYLALVAGRARPKGVVRRALKEGGKRVEAVTRYLRLEQLGGFALLELRPQTGRKHQIRRHLASIGLPLVGDSRYGPRRPRRVPGFPGRLWLHALRLELPDRSRFEAPLAPELAAHLELLRQSRTGGPEGPPVTPKGEEA